MRYPLRLTRMSLPRCTAVAVTLVLAMATTPVGACSFTLPPFEGFDRREYVFYGEVTGYASVMPPQCVSVDRNNCDPSWGVVLEVLESVHMPRETSTVELYWFGLDSMCGQIEVGAAQVRKIPVGSRFKVVARELEKAPARDSADPPALDGSDWVGAIVVPFGREESVAALAESRFLSSPRDASCSQLPARNVLPGARV